LAGAAIVASDLLQKYDYDYYQSVSPDLLYRDQPWFHDLHCYHDLPFLRTCVNPVLPSKNAT
jgi:hypothetical protein